MHQGQTEMQHLKDDDETPTGMVNMGQINETTTLFITPEEYWRQATSEYHDLGYTNNILSGPEETPIDPKELSNKGYVKPFQQGRMYLINELIYYYDTPHTPRIRQLSLIVVPVKFRQVVISVLHVSLLLVRSHDQRTLFRILARFWCPMVNKELAQFIIDCTHF